MARASEHTPVPSRDPQAKSAEGVGKDLLADNYDGRLTMEVVGSMHEVGLSRVRRASWSRLQHVVGTTSNTAALSTPLCGMHAADTQRKAKMAQLSTGGFVVLPGGYGTFEELLEMVTWNQVGRCLVCGGQRLTADRDALAPRHRPEQWVHW